MRRSLVAASAVVAAITAQVGPASGQDATEIVGRAGRAYRGLSSLRAAFEQTIESRGQGDTVTSRGTVIQAGANLFAMRFDQPAGEAIVVDGKHVWIYTPSTAPNQVVQNDIPSDPVYGANLLSVLLDRPKERYNARYVRADTAGGVRVDVIELIPKSESIQFVKATVWLGSDDSLPRVIEIDESPGQRRTLRLSQLKPNAPWDKKTFKFEVPRGVRVVRGSL